MEVYTILPYVRDQFPEVQHSLQFLLYMCVQNYFNSIISNFNILIYCFYQANYFYNIINMNTAIVCQTK